MSDYASKQASEVRRGDRVLIEDSWLEVLRINPTQHPNGYLQILFLNGRSILVPPDQDMKVWEGR